MSARRLQSVGISAPVNSGLVAMKGCSCAIQSAKLLRAVSAVGSLFLFPLSSIDVVLQLRDAFRVRKRERPNEISSIGPQKGSFEKVSRTNLARCSPFPQTFFLSRRKRREYNEPMDTVWQEPAEPQAQTDLLMPNPPRPNTWNLKEFMDWGRDGAFKHYQCHIPHCVSYTITLLFPLL